MFYYQLKDGVIDCFTEIPNGEPVPQYIEENFIATNQKIIRLHNGSLAFEKDTDMVLEAKAIAEQEEAMRIASLQPTQIERIEALEADNESMNDLLLDVIDIIDSISIIDSITEEE